MKKNIIVCCDDMLIAMQRGEVVASLVYPNQKRVCMKTYPQAFSFCPWCGTKLPFPYESDDA